MIQISLKFVQDGPTDKTSALVQVMVWRRTGDKPLPEPVMAVFTYAPSVRNEFKYTMTCTVKICSSKSPILWLDFIYSIIFLFFSRYYLP